MLKKFLNLYCLKYGIFSKKSDSKAAAPDYHELTHVCIYLECVNGRDWGEDVELPSGQQQYICLDWSCGWAVAVSRDTE